MYISDPDFHEDNVYFQKWHYCSRDKAITDVYSYLSAVSEESQEELEAVIVEPVSKADIQKAVLVDTALEEVNLGASSKTVETSADAIEICKSVDEKVQVESPSKDMIRREVSMEEESPKELTWEEEAPIDAICTEETVQKENVKHEKLSVMFDSKNELDTDPLSNDKLPGDSHTKVDTLVENKKVEQKSISDEEEHQEMPNKDAESSETPILETSPNLVLRWRAY